MWIMTKIGFFSIVKKPGQKYLTVRSRCRKDLDDLRTAYMPGLTSVIKGSGTDYPYRALVSQLHFAKGLAFIGEDIDYDNFKNTISAINPDRARVYGGVWGDLLSIRAANSPVTPDQSQAKRLSVGGVVINQKGEVLLIEPKNHFDGYVWTFPKGSPKNGESMESAATREVKEETGVTAEILDVIPGEFLGGTTRNSYFLMKDGSYQGRIDSDEVSRASWVPVGSVKGLLSQTFNTKGRQRDLEVFESVMSLVA